MSCSRFQEPSGPGTATWLVSRNTRKPASANDRASKAAAVFSGGTSSELTFAYRRGIPVYLVTDTPAAEISGWMLACADRVFANVDELKKFLLDRYGKEKQAPLWRV